MLIAQYISTGKYNEEIEAILKKYGDYSLIADEIHNANFAQNRIKRVQALAQEALIEAVNKCRARDVKVFVLSYPMGTDFLAQALLNEEKVAIINIQDEFLKIINSNNMSDYFLVDGHCSALGNFLLAQTVGDELLTYLKNSAVVFK